MRAAPHFIMWRSSGTASFVPLVLTLLLGCSDRAELATNPPSVASLRAAPPSLALEPFETRVMAVQALSGRGSAVQATARPSWMSSNPQVASVDENGNARGRGVGSTTITVSLSGHVATVPVTVAWRPDPVLDISGVEEAMALGSVRQLELTVRERPIAHGECATQWTSSDPVVASIDRSGIVTANARGTSEITARCLGLESRRTLTVTGPNGWDFGYAYLTEQYGLDTLITTLEVPARFGFSTFGGTTRIAFFGDPTGFGPWPPAFDFGWMRGGYFSNHRAESATMHVVALDTAVVPRCDADVTWFGCWAVPYGRLEALALSSGTFDSGYAAFVMSPYGIRVPPYGVNVTRTAGGGQADVRISERAHSDWFWFISTESGSSGRTCVLAPHALTPPDVVVRVLCSESEGLRAVEVNAVGIGRLATRYGEPAVFAEVDAMGQLLRRAEHALSIAVRGGGAGATIVTVTGDAIAARSRLPALLLSAVAVAPTSRCAASVPAPAQGHQNRLEFAVRCTGGPTGFNVGVTY